jgi:thioredoxin reductase (NADPH)
MYDILIIGAGPAGMSAGIYAGRYKLNAAIFEATAPGGQMLLTRHVCNYAGVNEEIGGFGLAEKIKEQLDELNVPIINEEVAEIKKEDSHFVLKTQENKKYETKSIIVATGAKPSHLNIPGEEELLGRGVSYCATCDAKFFQDKVVAVIGGGDTALEAAVFLSKSANRVYIIHRRQEFRGEEVLVDEVKSSDVELVLDTVCTEIKGDKKVEKIFLENVKTKEKKELPVDGVFINVGVTPVVNLAERLGVEVDKRNYVVVDRAQKTNVDGVYAAGDITGGLRQVSVAVGEGATAAYSAFHYIKNIK